MHMHDLVNRSMINCGSSVDDGGHLVLADPMARSRRIVTVESREQAPSGVGTTDDVTCREEYDRITHGRTPGITSTDLRRSEAWIGNQHRIMHMMSALSSRRRPVIAVVAGGSISLGHGVALESARYADRLEYWMNDMYPLRSRRKDDDGRGHGVINVAAHGADMCAMAKRLNVLYSDLSSKLPPSSNGSPDLIVLEFAVNDYQGQDHLITVDSKKSIFFDGFRELVLCAEVVVHALLIHYPTAGILFLEMQTAIATRKTGALLHMGVGEFFVSGDAQCDILYRRPSRGGGPFRSIYSFRLRIPHSAALSNPGDIVRRGALSRFLATGPDPAGNGSDVVHLPE